MPMELRNCPRCGNLFTYSGKNLCPVCLAEDEKEYDTLRAFLKDNPRAGLEETSEATGVKPERILKFLREGRIVAAQEVSWIQCERCGKPIIAGRFCSECAGDLRKELHLEGPGDRLDRGDQDRMHTADLIKKSKK
ncbi:MAG TPA: MerR family transcriptional regulator [Bacillota bacterium]|jgi:flagellar operon protein (TIGR03826 family)